MSFYQGFGAMGANTAVDVVMPGNIKDEIRTIAFQFKTVDTAVQTRRAELPVDFLAGWKDFSAEWLAFATAHSSWLSNAWYKSYEKALEYRTRLEDWRGKLEGLTGKKLNLPATGPGPAPAKLPEISKFPWKPILYITGGVAAIFGIAKLFEASRDLKREFRPAVTSGPMLTPPASVVRNPPDWARDPEIWESAKLVVAEHAHRYENPPAVVVHVYKQLGGRIG